MKAKGFRDMLAKASVNAHRVRNYDSSFNLKPVGAIIDRPHNQTRGIISFVEADCSLMRSSRAVAWRSH